MDISKDSKKLLFLIYKSYLKKREDGMSRSNAISFGTSEDIYHDIMPESSADDVKSFLYELKNAGYIQGSDYDNKLCICELTNKAIVTLENYPKETFVSIASFLANFI